MIMWLRLLVSGTILLTMLDSTAAYAQEANTEAKADTQTVQPITVVELFTSQGCYSCPPADEYLGKLAKQEHVITLSCHVTYWNYIGWKDVFSRSFCDQRQRHYQSELVDGRRGVYTPQMIINGRYAAVGSRTKLVDKIIEFDRMTQAAPLAITVHQEGSQLAFDLPALPPSAQAAARPKRLFLFGTSGNHNISITKGENSGKKLPYFNPVEHVEPLGNWYGKATQKSIALPHNPAIKDWLVIAQSGPVGEIVAIGRLSVK